MENNKYKAILNSKFVKNINIPKNICNHVLGEKHNPIHRMTAGAGVMLIGILVAKGSGFIENFFVHYMADLVGYSLHGLGFTPFIEHFAKIIKNDGQ